MGGELPFVPVRCHGHPLDETGRRQQPSEAPRHPEGLRAEGVAEGDIPKLAAKAFEDACHRCNPRPVTQDDLAKLYAASL